MKKSILLVIACLTCLFLAGCASNPASYKTQLARNQMQETWINHINLDPNIWMAHADRWFYTDQPRSFNEYAMHAPDGAAITAMMVRVPDFTNIIVSGPYRVEIYGRQFHNSLFILGPNEAARHVAVDINGSQISIHPASDCSRTSCGNEQIIIRIGIHELQSLTANGSNFIEGKEITSMGLTVKSTARNEILLTGNMNVTCVTQAGPGTISIIGAYSPALELIDNNGNINISGHIGLRNVIKQGAGAINVIGMDTDGLKINSSGSGVTALAGYANLRKVTVKGSSRVYLYWVTSGGIYITLHDQARLGLAGSAGNIDLEADGSSHFEGKYLRVDNMYVTTRGTAHANVYPQSKLFANASDYSSIYFFGSPNVVSRYTSGSGIIIPIFNDNCPVPAPLPACKAPAFKGQECPVRRTNYKDEGNFGSYSRTHTYHHRKHTNVDYTRY
jgi:Putative auto-transporter adhesin, head GIN domain